MKKEIKISLAVTPLLFGCAGWFLFYQSIEVTKECEAGIKQFHQSDIRTICLAGLLIGCSVIISALNQLIQDKE